MKNNLKFNLKIPFPIWEIDTIIEYIEVKKASGIAFIILNAIQRNIDSAERFKDFLFKLGIPSDIYNIFIEELKFLIDSEIISTQYNMNLFKNEMFAEMEIKNFKLTSNGIKLFKDGTIPTGENKNIVAKIYFDCTNSKFSLNKGNAIKSSSDIDFTKLIPKDGFLETYCSENSKQFNLKPEEVITSINNRSVDMLSDNRSMSVVLSGDDLTYSFSKSYEEEFYDKYFNNLENTILNSKEFKCEANHSLNIEEVDKLFFPSDINNVINNKVDILISEGFDNAKCNVRVPKDLSKKILKEFKNKLFIQLQAKNYNMYSMSNCSINVTNNNSEITLPFLCKNAVSEEEFKNIATTLIQYYTKNLLEDSYLVINYFSKELNDFTICSDFILSMFTKNVDSNIQLLIDMNNKFKNLEKWKEFYINKLDELFESSCSEVKFVNFANKDNMLKPLLNILNLSEFDFYNRLCSTIIKKEKPEILFKLLEQSNVKTNNMLNIVNIIEICTQKILNDIKIESDSKLEVKLNNFGSKFNNLKSMLGISELNDYVVNANYDVDAYLDNYKMFSQLLNELITYESYAKNDFAIFEQYKNIFSEIQEIHIIEKNASNSPNKISKKYLTDLINKSQLKNAVCDLSIKLESMLSKHLKSDEDLFELIKLAVKKKIITKKDSDIFNEVRMYRNSFLHPNKKQLNLNIALINDAIDAIFELEKELK